MALNNVTRFRIRQPFTNLGVILLSIFALTCTNDAETPKVDCNTSTLSIQLVAKTNPGDCATADGTIEEVIYLGMYTRYVVALDQGGELTVVEQNLHTTSMDVLSARGQRVRLMWERQHNRLIGG